MHTFREDFASMSPQRWKSIVTRMKVEFKAVMQQTTMRTLARRNGAKYGKR